MTGSMSAFDPILIPMIRRLMPNIIANSIIGVQPMTGPTANIFNLRFAREHRVLVSKEHYKIFLRVNDRPKTQPLRAFRSAGYPTVDLNIIDTIPAMQWCREQFGEHGFLRFNTMFVFKDEDDAMAFRMRWL